MHPCKLMLTGGRGMVGRNLLDRLEKEPIEVLAPTSTELNLLDADATSAFMTRHRPDFVIHAAGVVGGIQANIRNPVSFLIQNLDMGRNIVLASREAGVGKLINLGSSCMYPRDVDTVLSEEMILQGRLEPTNEGYALAKIATARLCDYISREDSSFHYKTLIPCNLYGKYDKFDPDNSHLIPAILHKMHQACIEGAEHVEIWGDGTARREFMYAEDLADCLVKAIENFDSLPSYMNVGLGFDHTVNEYYETAASVVGFKGSFRHDLTKPVGMMRKLVSVERLHTWGWSARTTLMDGMRKTYQHYLTLQG